MLILGIMRAIIDLPDDQVSHLQATCERIGISRAEAVRRAIALYLAGQVTEERTLALATAFGLWQRRDAGRPPPDGLAYQKSMRSDWE